MKSALKQMIFCMMALSCNMNAKKKNYDTAPAEARLVEELMSLAQTASQVLVNIKVPEETLNKIVQDVTKLSIAKGTANIKVDEKTPEEQCHNLCGLFERYVLALIVGMITSELGVGALPTFLSFAVQKFGKAAIEVVVKFSMTKFSKTDLELLTEPCDDETRGLVSWIRYYFNNYPEGQLPSDQKISRIEELHHWIIGCLRMNWNAESIQERLANLQLYFAKSEPYLKSKFVSLFKFCKTLQFFFKHYSRDKKTLQGLLNIILGNQEHEDRFSQMLEFVEEKVKLAEELVQKSVDEMIEA